MIHLMACPQMGPLAERMAAENDGMILADVRWESFADGFPSLRIPGVDRLRNRDVVFLASFDSPGEIFRQLAVIYEIPRYAVHSFKVLLPYFPTGTMERVDEDGRIATAATLARMLSFIPFSMSGPAQVVIYDIHALQERFYFSDQVIPRLETALPLLKKHLRGRENLAIAYPDEGAWKRFARNFTGIPAIVAHKERSGSERRVTIREGNPEGRDVVVVDDLVQSGSTLLECRDELDRLGARSVSAFATHGVFPDDSWQRFVHAGFRRFWITDSCPGIVEKVRGQEPFEVLSLAEELAAIVRSGTRAQLREPEGE